MIAWTIYEVISAAAKLHGVKFRGRLRVYGIDNDIDVLVENATDKENCVRFALKDVDSTEQISDYIHQLSDDLEINIVMEDVKNPVLSKIKVNYHERYRDEL